MEYNKIIEIAKEINQNENIPKEGLEIVYYLSKDKHNKLDLELYRKTNKTDSGFSYGDIIELTVNEINFIFKIK